MLFEPLTLRGFTAPNRVMVSPMQQYTSVDGMATDYELVHLGRFALGGAGMVIAGATAIEPIARMTYSDMGLWSDDQIPPLARIARFLKDYGSVPGIQLVHAGRKASAQEPWHGMGPLQQADADARGDRPWPVIGPSAVAAGPGWQVPRAMTEADIDRNIALWADAARRAAEAGFEIIDLHGAHGYLLHAFLSPLSNRRTDRYGGSLENRMRYPLAVIEAMRAAIPERCAIFYRLSALDGIEGGWTLDDTILFCRELRARGVDAIDCSSGGAIADRSFDTRIRRGFAFHAPYSRAIREGTGMPTATVGLIVDPHQAEAALVAGDADIIAVGRELLADPHWTHRARAALCGSADYPSWHREAGWWLDKRTAILDGLQAGGETPMTRYASRVADQSH